jgi:ankyrin repeat protein
MDSNTVCHTQYLPYELVSKIIHYCDLYTANSLLCSCKIIANPFQTYTGTITQETKPYIFFGINRIIFENPKICKSLSDTAYINGLIHYAKEKDEPMFTIFLHNANNSQAKKHSQLYSCFNTIRTSITKDMSIYRGEKSIGQNISFEDKPNISTAIHIHLMNQPQSTMSLNVLLDIAMHNNLIADVQKILRTKKILVEQLQTYLYTIVCKGYTQLVQLLLDQENIQVNQADEKGWTALNLAASTQQVSIFELLLNHPKIDLNIAKQGIKSFFIAAESGCIEIVQLLLNLIDVNEIISYQGRYNTVLIIAAKYSTAILQLLLNHPKTDVMTWGEKALRKAFILDNITILLKDPRININAVDQLTGRSILYSTVRKLLLTVREATFNKDNSFEKTKLLLKHPHIDVNYLNYSKNEKGLTALYLATQAGDIPLVKLLLNHPQTNPNILCQKHTETALYAAINLGFCLRGVREEIIKLFLEHPKIDLTITNEENKTAFDCAIATKNSKIIDLIESKLVFLAKESPQTSGILQKYRLNIIIKNIKSTGKLLFLIIFFLYEGYVFLNNYLYPYY